jgi:hypothetical protein
MLSILVRYISLLLILSLRCERNTDKQIVQRQELKTDLVKIAHLHPPIPKTGVRCTGRYDVSFDGGIVVKGSRDPETDLARALLSKGTTGQVMVMDANTGKHRSTVNIEKAAKLRTVETGTYPRFRRVETYAESPPVGEDDYLVVPTLPDSNKAIA